MKPLLFDAWERNYIINYYRFLGKMRKNPVINRYEYLHAVKNVKKCIWQNRQTILILYLVCCGLIEIIWIVYSIFFNDAI